MFRKFIQTGDIDEYANPQRRIIVLLAVTGNSQTNPVERLQTELEPKLARE
jgi:hypothetical protein